MTKLIKSQRILQTILQERQGNKMTILSKQEREARGLAFNKFADNRSRVTVQETNAFTNGFQAGLNYNKARVDELFSRIQYAHSLDEVKDMLIEYQNSEQHEQLAGN